MKIQEVQVLGRKTTTTALSSANYAPEFTIHSFLQLYELATVIMPTLRGRTERLTRLTKVTEARTGSSEFQTQSE